MARINLPPGCAGFADGNKKYLAENGPGSHVNLDPTDPGDAEALRKLKNQDYASAGLVDAGPQKEFIQDKRKQGRWCPGKGCNPNKIWHAWVKVCPKCHTETLPEREMTKAEWPKDINGAFIP